MNSELSPTYYTLLGKLHDMEDQLVRQIPKMMDQATNPLLREALKNHLDETEEQRSRLDMIVRENGEGMYMVRDEAFEKMLSDAEQQIMEIQNTAVRDAFIIAAAQSVEHLEIAKYNTLIAWSKQMEERDATELLTMSLNEEEAAEKSLRDIAEGGIFTSGVIRDAVDTNRRPQQVETEM